MIGVGYWIREEEDGSFICSECSPWTWCTLVVHYKKDIEETEPSRIYNLFNIGHKGEFKCKDLKELKADCKIVIPKTQDDFIPLDLFIKGERYNWENRL